MFGKISIRNIPDDIWKGLERLASQHDRSVEAEARYALRAWVEPLTLRDERNARLVEVSTRLRYALAQVNEIQMKPLKSSHIAQAIGEQSAKDTADWFIGEKEPTFAQLEAIAAYIGVEKTWLQHGDGHTFQVEYARIPENSTEGVKWLLDLENAEKPIFLRIIRENSNTGSLAIVKQYDEWRCKTYTTPYHISEEIGAGGESSLTYLAVIFELLYKYYVGYKGNLIIKSYLLSKEKMKDLREGNIHPLAILKEQQDLPWWEDFWDENQFQKHDADDYWQGWKKFCQRINHAIEQRSYLLEEKNLIRSGAHAFLNEGRSYASIMKSMPPPSDELAEAGL